VIDTLETPRGKVTIRLARAEDLHAYRQLRLEALKNHPEAFSSDYDVNLARPPIESWAEGLNASLGDESTAMCFAEAGGQLVAMGGAFQEKSPKTAHNGTIFAIYVKPEWRGLHLGEAVVAACEEWARLKGISNLHLAVASVNTPALQVYLRSGFRVYGVDPRWTFANGTYYDEILMLKELS